MHKLVAREIPATGRCRVVIEALTPEIDCGRVPIKRVVGETVAVEADIFVDGHDRISAVLLFRPLGEADWFETPFRELRNDRWRAEFTVDRLGRYEYSAEAWVDHFATWRWDLRKRVEAGQVTATDLLIGSRLVQQALERAQADDRRRLKRWADSMTLVTDPGEAAHLALADELLDLMCRYPDRTLSTRYGKNLPVVVDPERARFSSWYELFPRSASPSPDRHGTFRDVENQLPRLARMGFDVLYLPPIHPIGQTNRKGKNNTPVPDPTDVGSPWAIGSQAGGHKTVDPHLGTLEDFRSLVSKAKEQGIDIALDIAFQCSPDHPYTAEHPEWFRHRPDGTIQYAENPPKKYEDIYPFDFETTEWEALWQELKDVVFFWIDQGVRIFRVDNPHTKPFQFWTWLIDEVKSQYPEVIFLSEAFTRPRIMYHLAKVGFTQSYTYFPWRNTAWELRQYHAQLTKTEVREYFRPNSWPNTPDILTEYLQTGGRPAFMARLVLAATLTANYGIYGPAYEVCENRPREPGSEEYLDSEKYQIRHWASESHKENISDFIALINRIRRENRALQSDWSLCFYDCDNPQILCYSKRTDDFLNVILVVVNLDPHHAQAGWIEAPPEQMGIEQKDAYQVHDLISGARYLFQGRRNFVSLDPVRVPAHIFRVRRKVRSERDFEYYL
ncbi:MAG TPA: alpha-1,4-glucan--maltose-1-phosphate maltosyltransferase [Acidobacteriota bacterium]|nr:alpha-1,4-glucan--maltose-1-phosphate maltosyltransferase [Acidobacteriota bacterium]